MSQAQGPSARDLTASAPDVGLALAFLVVWIAPGATLPGTVGYLVVLMMLEFVIIHSSAFMGTVALGSGARRGRAIALVGLGAFYTLFIGGISLLGKSWWPLISFWVLTVNRVLGVLIGQPPKGEEKRFLAVGWGVSVMFYLAGCFITILLPIPRLGLTPEVVESLHLPGTGLWIEQPHRALAFGFLYFAATAVSEAYGHRWVKVQPAAAEHSSSRGREAA